MNAFAQLQNVANKFNSKSCFDASERSKHYLKTCYPIHCSDTDTDIAFILQNLLCLIRRTNSYNLIPICRILHARNVSNFALHCKIYMNWQRENSADEDAICHIPTSTNNIQDFVKHRCAMHNKRN